MQLAQVHPGHTGDRKMQGQQGFFFSAADIELPASAESAVILFYRAT